MVVVPVAVPIGIAQVTGRVVSDDASFVQTSVFPIVLDALIFVAARVAFQRENIMATRR